MSGKPSLVYGVGINDSGYTIGGRKSEGNQWKCPYYSLWANILARCYNKGVQDKRPTYRGCKVCKEWLTFSNFRSWMITQDWEGKHLDKDILSEGSKIYSPDTCMFITPRLNSFLTSRVNHRGNLPIGVAEKDGKFQARCSSPFVKSGRKYLGLHNTPEEAYNAWLEYKLSVADKLFEEGDITCPEVLEKVKRTVRKFK